VTFKFELQVTESHC